MSGGRTEDKMTLKGGNETTKEELVGMLEELLSFTEPLRDTLSPEDRDAWGRISALTADARDGAA